jgi:hypothetical protein
MEPIARGYAKSLAELLNLALFREHRATGLAELSGVSIFEFLWTVQDIPASTLLIPPEHFRIWNGQCGRGKPRLGPSSVLNEHAFLDEWSANRK